MPRPTPEQIDRIVKAAFDDLDPQQMAVFRKMSEGERFMLACKLSENMRQLMIASERERHPNLSDEAINQIVFDRMMRYHAEKDNETLW